MRIYIRYDDQYYRADVSLAFARKHDNGALISLGLTVGESLSRASFKRLQALGQVTAVSRDEWNHSGCQSSCTLRGATVCRW